MQLPARADPKGLRTANLRAFFVPHTHETAMPPNEAEREERYQGYLESTVQYFAVVEFNGGKPWFSSVEERRDLWFRRYERPEPRAGIPLMSLAEIRGDHRWTPAEPTQIKEIA